MSHDTPAGAPAPHTPAGRLVGATLGLGLVLTLIVLAFTWPAVTADAKDLPVAITGPDDAVTALTDQLEEARPGALDLIEVADRDEAVHAVETRETYGGIVLGDLSAGEAPEVLTSSAAGGVTHQLMNQIAQQLQTAVTERATAAMSERMTAAQAEAAEATQRAVQDAVSAALAAAARGERPPAPEGPAPAPDPMTIEIPRVTVTEVVPLSDDDPNGSGFTAALFPTLLGGMIGGIGISIAVQGALRRVVATLLYAVLGGGILTGVLQGWFGALQGDWWWTLAALSLSIGAIAAPITGIVALVGRAGIAAGPVLMLLIGNPIAGVTVPKEFLPWQWGEIGQWFPPGASGTLLRDLSYFPAADPANAWIALGAWAAGGIVLSLVGHARTTTES
ncbi:hypothetical protein [Myceligenerans pegani]|uniref:ABC transporter permease n=1 Tax=Myceligenerans pegani TaxID=2776917 RepID=A0ABR9MRV6_9MICO|nr:hypothetical protein [Myceligenerans sp. TRM 65318]MBE1874112.1 hypothetical protein [Myceligenerans sp. TRM 65318]MBE3016384.1 hypothetical protein [Myceligenerans sp. TRM 65318]